MTRLWWRLSRCTGYAPQRAATAPSQPTTRRGPTVADLESRLPDPGHEEPVCSECGGQVALCDGSGLHWQTNWEPGEPEWVECNGCAACEPCPACRGTGRPRCPDCENGTVRTGPGPDDVECCERCEGEGLL